MNDTLYDKIIQLEVPVTGKELLTLEDVNSLPEGEVVIGLYPTDPKESLYIIKRVQHHDRISTYAVPHHIYIEQPAKWQYEVSGYGQYQLGTGLDEIRLWLPPEPVEPPVEDGDEVWVTMLL
jgi:hypothetical protein